MEAANKGAYEVAKKLGVKKWNSFASMGISLTSFPKGTINPYVQEKIMMKHFFARKWLLVRYSLGFVVFPGGFGTLDEFFEVLTLIQTSKMKKMPLILFDKTYWKLIIDWAEKSALENDLISQKDLELVHITSSIDEAADIIIKYCNCSKKDLEPLYKAK
ncbi:MAG: LOG family protein [bacterium]